MMLKLPQPEIQLWNTSFPTRANFDLSATLINFAKFRSEGHTFSSFIPDFPDQQQPWALAEHLTTQRSWSFYPTKDTSRHVYHNPTYTACLRSGNFWFDSPLFNEQGCYTTYGFFDEFRSRGENLTDFDLQFFRDHGSCVRYKEQSYHEALRPKPEVEDPSPPAQTAEEETEGPTAAQAQPELMKEDEDSEAAQEFVPGTVSDIDTSELPGPTAPPSPAQSTGNDGGGLRYFSP